MSDPMSTQESDGAAPVELPALPTPWDYCYVWNGPYGARKFTAAHHNGRACDDQVLVYTADQMRAYALQALAQPEQPAELDGMVTRSWSRFEAELSKADRVHALVNAGHYPGMSEAFDSHMGAACWTDLAYRQDAATWAAAWKAALGSAAPTQPEHQAEAGPVAPDLLRFEGLDDTLPVLHAKNEVAISGLLDSTFSAVLASNEPDAVHALLVELAHKSVQIAAKHLRPAPTQPVQALTDERAAFEARFPGCAPASTTKGIFCAECDAGWEAWQARAAIASAEAQPSEDDVLAALELSPERYRTEGGAINRAKLRATLLHPAEYLPADHWLRIAQPGRVTGDMVSRFLGWKLPKNFAPDCGISFDGRKDDEWNKNKTWPIGTNLLTADQARAMLEHVLASAEAHKTEAGPVAPIGVEAVAEVVEDEDGPRLSWLIEGGIHALPVGVVLVFPHCPITNNDGHGEVYAHPAPTQPQPVQAHELPPLPAGQAMGSMATDRGRLELRMFSSQDMRDYARAALASAPRVPQPAGQQGGAPVAWAGDPSTQDYASTVPQQAEPAPIVAWRKARANAIAAVETYNVALRKARAVDEEKGFGFTSVNPEYQAMTEASNLAHRLQGPALDALYAAPPAQRQPLSDEQIISIYRRWDDTPGTSHADLVRAVERAHGIGAAPDAPAVPAAGDAPT